MTLTAETRRVRVTVEGDAHQVPCGSVERLRIDYLGGTFLVNADSLGVTVEDVTPERTWTAGDVIAGDVLTYVRDGQGRWWGTHRLDGDECTSLLDDDNVTSLVDSALYDPADRFTVLRYQAGEQ